MIIAAVPANAILPPAYYARAAKESKIKAIATIVDVKTTYTGKHFSRKKALSRLEKVAPF